MNNEVQGLGVSVQAKIEGEYIAIGCAAACGWQFENELIGKTDVNAGLFRKKRVRISDCRGNVSGVTTTTSTATKLSIFHFLQEGVRRSELDMRFLFESVDGSIVSISGLFLVQAIGLDADVSAFCEFDLALEGTGNITMSEIDDPGELVCEIIQSDWWPVTEGQSGISGTGNFGRSFAGKTVLEVDREGLQHDIVDSGTPGNRQAKYTGGSSITFDPINPFNAGETIFVVWLE